MNKINKTLENRPFVFVDVETTGLSPGRDRIIELGMLRVEDGVVTKTLNTLINPGMSVSPNIQVLTGIHPEDIMEADPFDVLYSDVLKLLDNACFVAHNVRFDYAFVRNEFKRVGVSYSADLLCTAKLSRTLYKRYRRHNLSSIIDRHSIECTNRHRAYDDAKAMWEFFQIAQKETTKLNWQTAISKQLNNPTLPKMLDKEIVDSLPETPGIYKFYDKDGTLLYIGKSVNIKTRVKSHLTSDHLSAKQMTMCSQIADIDYTETAGELGALLLESHLIKTHKPIYNRQLREKKDLVILVKTTTEDGYDTVRSVNVDQINHTVIDQVMGVFRSKKSLKEFLSHIAKKYILCERLLGLHKTSSACFFYSLGECKGACINKESQVSYNNRFLLAFAENKIKPWYFDAPVVLTEYDSFRGVKDEFTIDKWCLLKHSGTDYAISSEDGYVFDIDTYKILVRYIQKIRSKKNTIGLSIRSSRQKLRS